MGSLSLKALLKVMMLSLVAAPAVAEWTNDLAGVRSSQLVGYGLVVGLDENGRQTSQTQFEVQSIKSMLARLGIYVPPDVNPQLENVALVMVTANLLPFAKPGRTLDVTVSSLGNAKSLRGGTLLMTPLKGPDGEVYAVAQGKLAVGGRGAGGSEGSRISIGTPTVGRVPDGATVEREVPSGFGGGNFVVLNLHTSGSTDAGPRAV